MIDPHGAKRDALIGGVCHRLTQTIAASDVFIALGDAGSAVVRYHYSDSGLRVCDDPLDDAFALDVLGTSQPRAASTASIYAPLYDDAATVGVVWIVASEGELEDDALPMLVAFSDHLSLALQTATLHARAQQLEEMVVIDALTGVANRRAFDIALDREWNRALRGKRSLAIALLDIDHFKQYNDLYGHPAGDACLQLIARECSASLLRSSDVFTRYGGEEFGLVLADADARSGGAIAERIRAAIAELAIPHAESEHGIVTASVGVASAIPRAAERASDLTESADRALYRAKATGRNRIVVVDGTTHRSVEVAVTRTVPPPTNLPAQLSTLIGRSTDLTRVADLLEHYRLVTLVGPGGVGKTRVALQATFDSRARFNDGTWIVELAPLEDDAHVDAKIAAVLGVHETPDRPLIDSIAAACRTKTLLLVLDNCEHLLNAVSLTVATLLEECPNVRILTTSRERLGVIGEATYRVPPLDLPARSSRVTAQTAIAYPAIRLFVERAKLVNPAFALTDENVRTVVDIARRLDGIALAIELAAARVRSFDVERINALLDQRFRILTEGDRAALPHQQTLRATIDWSYQLLSREERVLFERLSVFSGGFTLESILAICVDDALRELGATDALTALVDKSLIILEGERYRLLESTREYARERRLSAGDHDAVASRHAAYMRDFVERLSLAEGAGPYKAWLAPLTAELDNLRGALAWTIGERRDIECGAAIAAALVETSSLGQWTEWADWNRRALESLPGNANPAVRGRLLTRRAEFASHYGGFGGTATACEAASEAVELLRDAEPRWLLEALNAFAIALLRADRRAAALEVAREGLAVSQASDDRVYQASFLRRIGTLTGETAPAEALAVLEQSVALCRELDNDFGLALSFNEICQVYATIGRYDDAADAARTASNLRRDLGDWRGLAYSLCDLATFTYLTGAHGTVVPMLQEALEIVTATDNALGLALVAQSVASLAATRGNLDAAARLAGFADAQFSTLGIALDRTARLRRDGVARALQLEFDPEQLAALAGDGSRMASHEVEAIAGLVLVPGLASTRSA